MARGTCYHITDNIEEVEDCNFSEECLYDQIGELCVDYVADMNEDEQKKEIEDLLEVLRHYGFETGTEETEWGKYPFFSFTKEAREQYFKPRLEEAKRLMNELTLEDFAKNDPYMLSSLLEDDYGDCAYSGYAKSFDDFLRDSKPGTKYYVGNAVLMH